MLRAQIAGRTLLTAAAIALALSPPVIAQERGGPAPSESAPRPPVTGCERGDRHCPPPRTGHGGDRGGGNNGGLIFGGAAVGVGLGLLIGQHYAGHHPASPPWDSEKKLDSEGPQLDQVVHFGEFEVEGYVSGGWPCVFNIDTIPGASVVLQVVVDGVDQSRLPMIQLAPSPAEPGDAPAHGWYARYDLPQIPELSGVKRARLQLTAMKDNAPAPLITYGVGAGPEAVGSVAVTVDSFGPSPVQRNADPRSAAFQVSFHNQTLFPQLSAQVTQQKAVENGGWQRTKIDSFDLLKLRQPISAPTVQGAWPRSDHAYPAAGDYDLDVVAFLPHGPWTMGFAPTPLQVR
ncbi:MAG: hypothetical protein JO111_13625 [Caulobacteraceae bacterium]|nr:hypothetical protein [Caulobacteraceae bacterium]